MTATDISYQANAIKLISRYLDADSATKGIYPFIPQKPDFDEKERPKPLPFKMPSLAGVSPSHLEAFLREITENKELDMQSLLIIKDGFVILRAEWGDYTLSSRKMTHSECKSLLSLAVGALIGEGKLTLESKVADLLSRRLNPILKLSAGNMTVRHLLTMTTGVVFNELGTVTDRNWLRSFFESGRKFPVGKEFDYNSLNSYLLSVIVREVSGESLFSYVERKILKPLGITGAFWEKSPEDIECGGFGLYIFPDDMAKLGLLVLNGGRWNGKEIIPKSYIDKAVTRQIETNGTGDFDYGLHIWVGKDDKSFLFNGMFGQNLLCYPENGVIIVSNASNGETFQQGPFYAICKRFLGKEIPKPKNAVYEEALLLKRLYLLKNQRIAPRRFPKELKALIGARYELNGKKPSKAGIMPFILGAIRNYYTEGMTELYFTEKKNRLFINFVENGLLHSLPVGFYKTERSVYDACGEKYRVAIRGSLGNDTAPYLLLRISFLEASNARLLKIYFSKGGEIKVNFSESPNNEFIISAVKREISKIPVKAVSERIFDLLEGENVKRISENIFSPTLSGRRIN